MESKKVSGYSELRQDLISGEWVVIATGRARRPNQFASPPKAGGTYSDPCPFEVLESDAVLVMNDQGETVASPSPSSPWFLEVIPNKYPAFSPRSYCPEPQALGPHRFIDGVGFHEVIVTRPHDRSIGAMTLSEVGSVVQAYQRRLSLLQDEACVEYVSILHNHGSLSGASIEHPHSQLIAIPVVPPDIARSLSGSRKYFETEGKCVHCVVVEFELHEGKRVVFENEQFVVIAPFASHAAFELRIFPKKHAADFQMTEESSMLLLAEALRLSLAKLRAGLNNPSYNFFIHTAPVKSREAYQHYHWHVEILPKTSPWGGFEFGTGIEISTIAPEEAAEFLRAISAELP